MFRSNTRVSFKKWIIGLTVIIMLILFALLSFLSHASAIKVWTVGGPVVGVAFRPNNHELAVGFQNGNVEIRDLSDERVVSKIDGRVDELRMITYSPDGRWLVGAYDGLVPHEDNINPVVKLWNADNVTQQKTIEGAKGQPITSVAFSGSGKLLAVRFSKFIQIWEVGSWRLFSTLELADTCGSVQSYSAKAYSVSGGTGLAFSPDDRILAACVGHGIQLWGSSDAGINWQSFSLLESDERPEDINLQAQSPDSPGAVYTLAFSPNGALLASGHGESAAYKSIISTSKDTSIRIWSVKDKRLTKTLMKTKWGTGSLAFSPDGQILATGGGIRDPYNREPSGLLDILNMYRLDQDADIRLWNVNTGSLLNTLKGHTNFVSSIVYDKSGSLLASGSEDNTVRLWNTK